MPLIREQSRSAGSADLPQSDAIKKYIALNMAALIKSLGISQREFAGIIDIAPSALNEYLKQKTVPSVVVLARICNNSLTNRLGFTLQDFINSELDFSGSSYVSPFAVKQHAERTAYWASMGVTGTYMLCFADTSTPLSKEKPLLKYGVLHIYENEDLSAASPFSSLLKIFPEYGLARSFWSVLSDRIAGIETDDALTVKKTLHSTFGLLNDAAEREMCYIGGVSFPSLQSQHMFIQLENTSLGDNATFIFNFPPKRHSNKYIGGLGIVASISRGMEHIPVTQKAILSSRPFDFFRKDGGEAAECTEAMREEILYPFLLVENNIKISESDTEELARFCFKIAAEANDFLNEDDKQAMICNRIKKLIFSRVKEAANGVCGVSALDDRKVYDILKNFSSGEAADNSISSEESIH